MNSDESPRRGRYNSSRTRVVPVLRALENGQGGERWLHRLISMGETGIAPTRDLEALDLRVCACHWDDKRSLRREKALRSPLSLLEWLVNNVTRVSENSSLSPKTLAQRRLLKEKDPATIAAALDGLRKSRGGRAWYVLEGPSYPDAYVVTPDLILLIEGKRTERDATTKVTWMTGRDQMLRHLDAAWEIRGDRHLLGMMIVDSGDPDRAEVPRTWQDAARAVSSAATLASSLSHRSPAERDQIASTFAGVTTWQRVVRDFGLRRSLLA